MNMLTMRHLTKEDIAAIYRVPPHLIGGERKRFWRLRGWLLRCQFAWYRVTRR